MFSRRKRSPFSVPQPEPLFVAIPDDDPAMLSAYAMASATMPIFQSLVLQPGSRQCCAKLRFRDPDESARTGEDCLLYLWLGLVSYDPVLHAYSGAFFEVPPELTKWHSVGQRLSFETEDVFDWFANEDGILHGGFTLRVVRANLPTSDRLAYDQYIGIRGWAPVPLATP